MEAQDKQLFDDDEQPGVDEPYVGDEQPSISESRAVKVMAVETAFHPDLQNIKSATLKDGPRSLKIAKFSTIRDRHTGEAHHEALSIQTFHRKQGQLNYDRKHTISLSSEGEDEIQMLLDFLLAVRGATAPESSDQNIPAATLEAPDNAGTAAKADLFADLLRQMPENEALQNAITEQAVTQPGLFTKAAITLKLAAYRAALQELTHLIQTSERAPESKLQHLFAENPWMLGTEYSEVITRQYEPPSEPYDGFMRRTVDGALEWIEIKAPFQEGSLFQHDFTSNSYYPGSELAKAIGQVQQHLETLDSNRNPILESENTDEIGAKIIIGRDGDTNQQNGLRRLNRHLHRIEVLTYDQLHRLAGRVVSYLENQIRAEVKA